MLIDTTAPTPKRWMCPAVLGFASRLLRKSWVTANRKLTHDRRFAYLFGLCFPKKRDEQKNAGTLGLVTQDRSVIHRADGVPIGVEAT